MAVTTPVCICSKAGLKLTCCLLEWGDAIFLGNDLFLSAPWTCQDYAVHLKVQWHQQTCYSFFSQFRYLCGHHTAGVCSTFTYSLAHIFLPLLATSHLQIVSLIQCPPNIVFLAFEDTYSGRLLTVCICLKLHCSSLSGLKDLNLSGKNAACKVKQARPDNPRSLHLLLANEIKKIEIIPIIQVNFPANLLKN